MRCSVVQFEKELPEISFPFHSESHDGVVVSGIPTFCDCRGFCSTIYTPAKGMVREFARCIEFDYAVFCPDCETTRPFICRYYPEGREWKIKYHDQPWVNIIDLSKRPWHTKLKVKTHFLITVIRLTIERIRETEQNKVVYTLAMLWLHVKALFKRNER